jgi:hypothetical protein
MAERLEDLLRACTVQILGGPMKGTGFFVAPGLILTCAHVIGDSERLIVRRTEDGQNPVDATVIRRVAVLADQGHPIQALTVDYPDIAVIQVEGMKGHPCVVIDPEWPWQGDTFQAYGFPSEGGSVRLASVQLTYRGVHGTAPAVYMDLAFDTVKLGMSGAAVLNLRTGGVCGVIVASKHTVRPDGGLAVPWSAVSSALSEVLAANRRFHKDNKDWKAAVTAASALRVAGAARARPHSRRRTGGAPVERRKPMFLVPPLPEHFSSRPEIAAEVKSELLKRRPDGPARMVGLVGMGGAGKSVLARAMAWDKEIIRTFRDGIVWLELGPAPNLLARQNHLAGLFGDQRAPTDLQEGLSRLNELLAGAECLIVLDNVWERDHLSAFDLIDPTPAILITSRNRELFDRPAVIRPVGPLAAGPARRLLADWARQDESTLSTEAEEVAQECGGLPLALAVAGGMVADSEYDWHYLRERLRQADLHRLEINLNDYKGYHDILRVLDASVSGMSQEQRGCYLDLAIFDGRGNIPVDAARQLWHEVGFGNLDMEYLIVKLARRSLLQYDKAARTFTLHDLQFDYARHLLAESLPAVHGRLASAILNKWGGLEMGLPGLRRSSPKTAIEHYGILHMIAHLKGAGRADDIHRLLAVGGPGATTEDYRNPTENTWYAAHDNIGEAAAFSEDVGIAWELAKASWEESSAGETHGETGTGIGLEIRYALISSGLASIAARIPSPLIIALVSNGTWTVEQGLAHIRRIPRADARARTLVELLAALNVPGPAGPSEAKKQPLDHLRGPEDLASGSAPTTPPGNPVARVANEALAMAAVSDLGLRASILTSLAPLVSPTDQEDVIRQAWDAVRALPAGNPQATAIAALLAVDKLPAGLNRQILQLACEIHDPKSRASILTALIPFLRGADRATATNGSLTAIRAVDVPEAKAAAWLSLLAVLPKARRDELTVEAQQAARFIPRNAPRAKALAALVAHLPKSPGQSDLLTEAWNAASALRQPEPKAQALTTLIFKAPGDRRRRLVIETMAAAREVPNPQKRAALIAALIPKAAKNDRHYLLKKLLSYTEEIPDPRERALGLIELVPYDSEYRIFWGGFSDGYVIRLADAITDPGERATVLTALALRLPARRRLEMLARALAEARSISDISMRTEAFAALVRNLPMDDRGELASVALADIHAYKDPKLRATGLAILAPLLPTAAGRGAIGEALLEVDKIPGHRDRLELCAVLAPVLPQAGRSRILKRASADANAIYDAGMEVDALAALVAALPEVVLFQANGVETAVAKTLTQSAVLSRTLSLCFPDDGDTLPVLHRILEAPEMRAKVSRAIVFKAPCMVRFPASVQQRIRAFKGAQDLIAAIESLCTYCGTLAKMVAVESDSLEESGFRLSVRAAAARAHSKMDLLAMMAAQLPEFLQEKLLASVEAVDEVCSRLARATERGSHTAVDVRLREMLEGETEFLAALRALTRPVGGHGQTMTPDDVWNAALAVRAPERRVVALLSLMEHLPEEERAALLAQGLADIRSIDDPDARSRVLKLLAERSLEGSIPPWEPYWRSIVEDAATRGRAALMSDFPALGPVMLRFCGTPAVKEAASALLDVGRWWP